MPVPPSLSSTSGRRKGPKNLPTLPLSAFSPPNTGTSESFPIPPTPSTVVLDGVIDSHLRVTAEGQAAVGQDILKGVVFTLDGQQSGDVVKSLEE